MGLFKTRTQKAVDASAKIVDVFTKTVTDLQAVNEQIDNHEMATNEKISKLNSNLRTLKTTRENNNKVIAKISKIFED